MTPSERREAAVKALREPDYTFAKTPNTVRQSVADIIETDQAKIEIIYGLLWCMSIDTSTPTGKAASLARKAALEMIDKAGQERGIRIAQIAVRSHTVRDIQVMPVVSPRAGNE